MTAPLPPDIAAAWASAQALWNVRVARLTLKPDAGAPSFAWFSFPPEVTVDPVEAASLGVHGEWESILAHELGHHVLAPSTRLDGLKILQQCARALSASWMSATPRDLQAAPMLANLWEDMLINVRVAELQRRVRPDEEPGIVRMWRRLRRGDPSRTFWVVLRAYEDLWGLAQGALTTADPPPAPVFDEADPRAYAIPPTDPRLDAQVLAATVRTFGADAVSGALRAGMVLAPYLLEDPPAQPGRGGGGCGGEVGRPDPTARELGEVLRDPRLSEDPLHPLAEGGDGAAEPEGDPRAARGQGYDLADTLAVFGASSHAAVLEAWYLARSRRWVRPYREPDDAPPPAGDDYPAALEVWESGDDLAAIDWPGTLAASPVVVPGITTRRRTTFAEDAPVATRGIALDLYVDSSGSMPHPQHESPGILAAVILILSVLDGGGRVRVTSFSSAGQVAGTSDYARNASEAVAAALTFFGGGTVFPLDLLRDRYASRARTGERRHLVVISDDGSASFFGAQQEHLATVATDIRPRLDTATLVLIDPRRSSAGLAKDAGYDVEYLDSLTDAPAACAALAARIAQGVS